MGKFLIVQNKKHLPKLQAAVAGLGLAVAHADHAFAQANTLGAMAIGSTADLVDTSTWGTLVLWLFAIGFLVAAIYHAVMHRNGRATVPDRWRRPDAPSFRSLHRRAVPDGCQRAIDNGCRTSHRSGREP